MYLTDFPTFGVMLVNCRTLWHNLYILRFSPERDSRSRHLRSACARILTHRIPYLCFCQRERTFLSTQFKILMKNIHQNGTSLKLTFITSICL